MALNGSLKIILIVAVVCIGLYFLQNMSSRRQDSNRMISQMQGQVENYAGQNIDHSQYDIHSWGYYSFYDNGNRISLGIRFQVIDSPYGWMCES